MLINAIILAAGESKRMGKPKPLLKFDDKTFLGHIIEVLECSDINKITVVLGANAGIIKESVDLSGVDVVINEDWQKGQLSSLIAGLNGPAGEADAILVCLVDHPFITREVVNELVKQFAETKSPIIVPVFERKRGHPALFARRLFSELRNAPEEQGARYVVRSNKDRVREFETTENGILVGIDSPDDYELHLGTNP